MGSINAGKDQRVPVDRLAIVVAVGSLLGAWGTPLKPSMSCIHDSGLGMLLDSPERLLSCFTAPSGADLVLVLENARNVSLE